MYRKVGAGCSHLAGEGVGRGAGLVGQVGLQGEGRVGLPKMEVRAVHGGDWAAGVEVGCRRGAAGGGGEMGGWQGALGLRMAGGS